VDDATRDDDVPTGEAGTAPRKRGGAWRWWVLGIVCAIALGIFMWAVGGQWNLAAPTPTGQAASPAEAVQKFMAAVDNHDEELARTYTTDRYAPQIDNWISRAGDLRFYEARAARPAPDGTGAMILGVSYGAATRFLDGDYPLGLNLALVVWPQPLKRDFTVVQGPSGEWLVDGATEAQQDEDRWGPLTR
jgi:hypothetical protein